MLKLLSLIFSVNVNKKPSSILYVNAELSEFSGEYIRVNSSINTLVTLRVSVIFPGH